MVLNQVHNGVKTTMDSTAVIIYITKVHGSWRFLIFGNVDGMFYQLVDALIFGSRNRNDRDTKHFLHLVDHNRTAVIPHFIHHI